MFMTNLTIMKNILIFSVLVLLGQGINSQVFCSYSGNQCANGLSNATPYATGVVSSICSSLGVAFIQTYQGNVGNACASTYQNQPIITYNPTFLGNLYYQNQWAPISVLAHEVGHHVNGHSSWYGSFKHSWTRELEADFVSGYALYKMGASLNDALYASRVMFSAMGSSSHPDTPKRMDAIAQGYSQAALGF